MPKGKTKASLVAPFNRECPICISTPSDPIKLPCDHILCLSCLKQNVELTSLHCPLCKRRIGIWNRRMSASGGLQVDVKLKRWLQSQAAKKKEPSKRQKVSKRLLSDDYEMREKESLALQLETNLEEQQRLQERIQQEKEDEKLARSLYNAFNAIVDRSSESVDAYPMRSRKK